MSRQTGLRFELVPAASREEALALLRSGDAAMMVGLMESAAPEQGVRLHRDGGDQPLCLVSRSKGPASSRTSVARWWSRECSMIPACLPGSASMSGEVTDNLLQGIGGGAAWGCPRQCWRSCTSSNIPF